jgi:hypothetical protein
MRSFVPRACIVAFLSFLSACSESSSSAPSEEPLPVGVDMLGSLDRIAVDRGDVFAPLMVSTYDRTGGNLDFHLPPQNVLEVDDEGRTILFDQDGPGVVTRIWLTHFSVRTAAGEGAGSLVEIPGDILFYFDDERTPRVEMSLQDFFSGEIAPFLGPFVLDPDASSGGFISSLPITYREHLRIVSTESIPYLQVNAFKLLDGEVESFSPGDVDMVELDRQREAWTDAEQPLTSPDAAIREESLTAAPGSPLRVVVEGGPATVARISLTPTKTLLITPLLRLQVNVDGGDLEVDAPFGDFFLTALEQVEARGRVVGHDGGTYYVTFPMPYDDQVEVVVAVEEGGDAAAFDVAIETVPGHPAGDLRFHAAFSDSLLTPDDGDHPVLDVEGRGHLAGSTMVLCCIADCSFLSPRFAHLEGDERIYIDGAEEPQLHGTGAEDYFNSGFYYAAGSYHQPTHGMPFEQIESDLVDPYENGAFDCTTQYRLQLTDVVPFRTSLRFDLERGPTSNLHTYFRSVAYWYQAK